MFVLNRFVYIQQLKYIIFNKLYNILIINSFTNHNTTSVVIKRKNKHMLHRLYFFKNKHNIYFKNFCGSFVENFDNFQALSFMWNTKFLLMLNCTHSFQQLKHDKNLSVRRRVVTSTKNSGKTHVFKKI